MASVLMDARRERPHTGIGRVITEWRALAEGGSRRMSFLEHVEVPDRSPGPREPHRIAGAMERHGAALFHATYPYVALPRGVRSLLSLHDTLQLTFGRRRAAVASALIRRNVRHSTAVLTLSHAARTEICERLGLDPERILVTPLGVRVPPQAPATRLEADQLLYVGGDKPHKHLPELIAWGGSVARDRGLRLVMVVPEAAVQALAPAAAGLPVQLRSRLTDSQLHELQDSALAYVSLARDEGFGLPPLEAAARSVPSVLLDSGAHREVMGDAATYCVMDRDSFDAAVDTLLAEVPAMRERARQRALQWTWEASWASVEAAYERFA